MTTGSLVKQIGRPSATGPMSDVSSVIKSVVIEKDHRGRGGFSMAAFSFMDAPRRRIGLPTG